MKSCHYYSLLRHCVFKRNKGKMSHSQWCSIEVQLSNLSDNKLLRCTSYTELYSSSDEMDPLQTVKYTICNYMFACLI